MKNNEEVWENASNKIVLYLDIMGFKERVNKTDASELKKNLLSFKDALRKLKPLKVAGITGETLIEMAQFSDSIVLVTRDSGVGDLNRICKAAVIIMQEALKNGFALRGAIAKGDMIFDKGNQLFFGQALVATYLLEEELCYYGIVFHESMEECVEEAMEKKKSLPIEDIEVPLKKGKASHYHIAWNKLNAKLDKEDVSDEVLEWLKDIRKTVSGNPRVYLDNTIKIIRESTKVAL